MGLLLQEEHILHFRETQWVFSSDVRETLVLFAVCPFFVISFIFFTFDNILYAQKHHSRSKLISLRLKNHINIRLQLQIADYHISLFIIYKRLRLQSMQNTDLINPCNRGTKPNSSLLLTRS